MPSVIAGIIALSAWLGAMVLVAAVVAPAAFAVLPTRTLAGALVGRVLPALFGSGIVIGLGVASLSWSGPTRGWIVGSALVLVAACATAQFVVAPRIERVRAGIGGPVDALDATDRRRQAFGRLHGMSVALMGLGGVAAAAALTTLVRRLASPITP